MKILGSSDKITSEFLGKEVAPFVPFLIPPDFRILKNGYDNYAVDLGTHILRFPQDEEAIDPLTFESRICAIIPKLRLEIPKPAIVTQGAYVFSWHKKIPGEHLTTQIYENLKDAERDDIAERLVELFLFFHAIKPAQMVKLGCKPLCFELSPADLRAYVPPMLPSKLLPQFQKVANLYDEMDRKSGNRPIIGYFDAHGQNMAYNTQTQTLTGIYDFGSVSIGPREREFSPLNHISVDLKERCCFKYEKASDLRLDRQTIDLLCILDEYINIYDTPTTGYDSEHFINNLYKWERELSL